MSKALQPVAMKSEALARHVETEIVGAYKSLADLKPFIQELWTRFDNLKDGETIHGCTTRKDYCERVLDKSYRAVHYMLNGGNPMSNRRPSLPTTNETVSLPITEQFEVLKQQAQNFVKTDFSKLDLTTAAKIAHEGLEIQNNIAIAKLSAGRRAGGILNYIEDTAIQDTNPSEELIAKAEQESVNRAKANNKSAPAAQEAAPKMLNVMPEKDDRQPWLDAVLKEQRKLIADKLGISWKQVFVVGHHEGKNQIQISLSFSIPNIEPKKTAAEPSAKKTRAEKKAETKATKDAAYAAGIEERDRRGKHGDPRPGESHDDYVKRCAAAEPPAVVLPLPQSSVTPKPAGKKRVIFSDADKQKILDLSKTLKQADIAKKYGVSQPKISNVLCEMAKSQVSVGK